jgi:hypothetical protein
MALDLSLGAVVNAASSVPLVALGLWVLTVKPRRRATLALAVYSVSFGLIWIPDNVVTPDDPIWSQPLAAGTFDILILVAALTLPVVGLLFPRPLRRDERRTLVLPVLGFVVVTLPAMLMTVFAPSALVANPALLPAYAFYTLLIGSILFVVLLAPLRFAAARPGREGERERGAVALMGAALGLFPAVFAGSNANVPELVPYVATILAVLALAAVLWLRNAARSERPQAVLARNVAVLALAPAVAGALVNAAWGSSFSPAGGPQFGLARMLGVLLLAYAILRHQLLGIDVKVKWTIKQSTIAAAFIGVFFVVSEGAQQLFSTSLGPLVGIAAAGGLVFAMAPLQHLAERVANAAVPGVGEPGQLSAEERRTAYAEAAKLLWMDGVLTVKERHALDGLRARLGLRGEEAQRIERAVTEELERAGPAPARRQRR